MLSPKRTKFRKAHKEESMVMQKGTTLNFGAYKIKSSAT